MYRFEFFAIGNTAANIVNDFAHGNTHWNFCQTGVINLTGKSKYFSAFRAFSTILAVPICTINNDLRNVSKSFYVIDVSRFTPQAGNCRERRTRTRHTAFTFDGSHERSFFTANESACTFFDMQFKIKTAVKNIIA